MNASSSARKLKRASKSSFTNWKRRRPPAHLRQRRPAGWSGCKPLASDSGGQRNTPAALRNPQSHSQARPRGTVEGGSVAISISVAGFDGSLSTAMEPSDAEVIAAVLAGQTASFEYLVRRYSPRVFATARRYARRESEVEDIAQEVWSRAFQKLSSFRAEAPFEHWLMRMAVRTCYDFLRNHQ